MPKLLNEARVARDRERGYHFPIDALSAAEVAAFLRQVEDVSAIPPSRLSYVLSEGP